MPQLKDQPSLTTLSRKMQGVTVAGIALVAVVFALAIFKPDVLPAELQVAFWEAVKVAVVAALMWIAGYWRRERA